MHTDTDSAHHAAGLEHGTCAPPTDAFGADGRHARLALRWRVPLAIIVLLVVTRLVIHVLWSGLLGWWQGAPTHDSVLGATHQMDDGALAYERALRLQLEAQLQEQRTLWHEDREARLAAEALLDHQRAVLQEREAAYEAARRRTAEAAHDEL